MRLYMTIVRTLSTFEELDEVMTNLHDCAFDLTRAHFAGDAHTWTGVFLRPVWEDSRAEHTGWWLWGSTRLPVVEATVALTGVMNETVNDEEGIENYGFIEVIRLPSGVRFRFAEHLAIDLQLSDVVSGRYDERPQPEVVAVYRQRLLVQTGPLIERAHDASAE